MTDNLPDDGVTPHVDDGTIDELRNELSEGNRQVRRRNRLLAVLVAFGVIAFALNVVFTAVFLTELNDQVDEIERIGNANNKILNFVEEQTSPERQRRQQEALDGILFRVNCDTREALEDFAEAIEGTIIVITDNCPPEGE